MKSVFNQQLLLWTIGVLQPVSLAEIHAYWAVIFKDAGRLPDVELLKKLCGEQLKDVRIIRVDRKNNLYSLTERGNLFMSQERRYARDRARLFLLKETRKDRVQKLREESASGLGGVAPSADTRTSTKGREANKTGPVVPSGHSYWPRFNWQLFKDTGLQQASRNITPLSLLSFADNKQLALACGKEVDKLQLDFRTIGLMLGISPGLVVQIMVKPDKHYRSFEIPKRGGGTRNIESPRTFLKVIQQFLADYFLSGLPIHDSVHSFRQKHSIVTNASQHCQKPFVANIDIENFFGMIRSQGVQKLLRDSGYSEKEADIIGGLCTKWEVLPQGAPTSPTISNAYLFEFDETLSQLCQDRKLAYSRYADDITISGSDLDKIKEVIGLSEKLLFEKYELKLNKSKTRIASQYGQQRVTGVVVNETPRPPRKFRRNVRAAICNAARSGDVSAEQINRLNGYVSYLESFDVLRGTKEIDMHRTNLIELRKSLSVTS